MGAWRYVLLARGRPCCSFSKGYSQRGIAGKLDASDNTVRTRMRNLYRKLQIHSHQDAIELVEGFGRGRARGSRRAAYHLVSPVESGPQSVFVMDAGLVIDVLDVIAHGIFTQGKGVGNITFAIATRQQL